ncbi:carboxypeptidase regulatory-like domain-containing protein [Burkholderia glumae]|uniref:carboxypeptidase regulatory-like domain-containing protein n=2 Tax=Burkholderia glumae TaxID=337 RepID=UPI00148ECBFB|nr:carboxypeptidase regulatory-like domain-containing protein [Burkholderia glumae]MCQ0031277.1 carboxypeptidase regulatory-like domain-containing protein [Burkholderia glumae]QJW81464.1 carboxypeptidase regulatory-like domain-containing protein [Burkholderia glumae]UVS87797.1 carboxypeptidase regulatory-like domain-containing protein [Burkholderia glumae]
MSRARGRAGRRAGRGRPPLPGGTAGCLLALALSCSPARAMPAAGAPAVAAQDAPRIVPGAVAAAQVETLRAVASRYNLRIAIISARGDYLSGIDFEIASGRWPLFRARTAGAFLAAHLSPGPYTIRARHGAIEQVREVLVPARGAVDLRIAWPDPGSPGTAPR